MEPRVKTIKTNYIVKINNEPINEFDSIWGAKKHISSLIINDDINTVDIVKLTTTETVLKSFKTKTAKILTINDLDEGLE